MADLPRRNLHNSYQYIKGTSSYSRLYKHVLRITLSESATKVHASADVPQVLTSVPSSHGFFFFFFFSFVGRSALADLRQSPLIFLVSICCPIPVLQCILNGTQLEFCTIASSPRRQWNCGSIRCNISANIAWLITPALACFVGCCSWFHYYSLVNLECYALWFRFLHCLICVQQLRCAAYILVFLTDLTC